MVHGPWAMAVGMNNSLVDMDTNNDAQYHVPTFTDLDIEKKIPPMALRAGL